MTALDRVLRFTNRPDCGGVTSPLVILLLRALARCGGPIPRPPQRTILHQDGQRLDQDRQRLFEPDGTSSTAWTQVVEESEWLNDVQMGRPGRPRQPQWREAAALQRARHVRYYMSTVEYDPDVLWSPPPEREAAAAAAAEASARRVRQLKTPLERKRKREN